MYMYISVKVLHGAVALVCMHMMHLNHYWILNIEYNYPVSRYSIEIRHGWPHSDRKTRNGLCYSHLPRLTSRWQKTRKWSMPPLSAAADLTVTERPEKGLCHRPLPLHTSRWLKRSENGSCHRHPPQQTSQWQKDQKIVYAIAICSGKTHNDRNHQKMAHTTAIRCGIPHSDKRQENGPCHPHLRQETSRWQKDQKLSIPLHSEAESQTEWT